MRLPTIPYLSQSKGFQWFLGLFGYSLVSIFICKKCGEDLKVRGWISQRRLDWLDKQHVCRLSVVGEGQMCEQSQTT